MTWVMALLLAIPAVALVIALSHIYKRRKVVVAERWGIALALGGLFFVFLAYMFMGDSYSKAQVAFATGFFVLISSVGANILASAVTKDLER